MSRDDAKLFLSNKQSLCLLSLGIMGIGYALFSPINFLYNLIIVTNLLYLTVITLKVILILEGRKKAPIKVDVFNINDRDLPSYSILVPLFKEANILGELIHHLSNMNYPKKKLRIFLILEEMDFETRLAITKRKLASYFKVIIVPFSFPQTKPKACNYALKFVKSKYVVIYDAEDKPDILQLRKAAQLFESSKEENLMCVQASLNFYNKNETWLSKMFSLEYGILFRRVLPALDSLDLPLLLGGSSNHFKVSKLIEIGAWDSYNVTEDADLGITIARSGYKVRMIDSTTWEEAPICLAEWIRQRGRWIKGFLQTYFVHMRMPVILYRQLGLKGFLAHNLLLGISNLLYILIPIICVLSLFIGVGMIKIPPQEKEVITVLTVISLLFGIISMVGAAYEIKNAKEWLSDIKEWWLFPLYLTLLPVASIVALYQIFTCLHFWAKTRHGITKFKQ